MQEALPRLREADPGELVGAPHVEGAAVRHHGGVVVRGRHVDGVGGGGDGEGGGWLGDGGGGEGCGGERCEDRCEA